MQEQLIQSMGTVLGSFWPLALLVAAAFVMKTAWFKGWIGEAFVNLMAQWRLDKDTYHLIKNVTLPTEGGSTQLDHIIVSIYGVFVVETKNLRGWIYGDKHHKRWTQWIYRQAYKFQNPLHQNYKHTKALADLLGLAANQIHSLVVFVGDSTFKNKMPENVVRGLGYIRYIESKTEPVLNGHEVQEIVGQIESGRLAASFKTHREHVRHVRQIVGAKQNEPACPRCGSAMIKRVAKAGPNKGRRFYGCEMFPKCRGIAGMPSGVSP